MYLAWKSLSYKGPHTDVYVEILDDDDVKNMLAQLTESNRVFHIYVDCGKMTRDM